MYRNEETKTTAAKADVDADPYSKAKADALQKQRKLLHSHLDDTSSLETLSFYNKDKSKAHNNSNFNVNNKYKHKNKYKTRIKHWHLFFSSQFHLISVYSAYIFQLEIMLFCSVLVYITSVVYWIGM